ncbi:MAG: antitoxin [Acidimicrobiales bacterium]
MSILDKAKGLIGKNRDKAKGGVDKGADVVDKKTGGAHSDKIDTAADKTKDAIDELPPQ